MRSIEDDQGGSPDCLWLAGLERPVTSIIRWWEKLTKKRIIVPRFLVCSLCMILGAFGCVSRCNIRPGSCGFIGWRLCFSPERIAEPDIVGSGVYIMHSLPHLRRFLPGISGGIPPAVCGILAMLSPFFYLLTNLQPADQKSLIATAAQDKTLPAEKPKTPKQL